MTDSRPWKPDGVGSWPGGSCRRAWLTLGVGHPASNQGSRALGGFTGLASVSTSERHASAENPSYAYQSDNLIIAFYANLYYDQ